MNTYKLTMSKVANNLERHTYVIDTNAGIDESPRIHNTIVRTVGLQSLSWGRENHALLNEGERIHLNGWMVQCTQLWKPATPRRYETTLSQRKARLQKGETRRNRSLYARRAIDLLTLVISLLALAVVYNLHSMIEIAFK
jgi:hypothetical protein